MNFLKKLIDFLVFGRKKEEPVVLEEKAPVKESTVQHCLSHIRFRKNCPDCLRAVGVM